MPHPRNALPLETTALIRTPLQTLPFSTAERLSANASDS